MILLSGGIAILSDDNEWWYWDIEWWQGMLILSDDSEWWYWGYCVIIASVDIEILGHDSEWCY